MEFLIVNSVRYHLSFRSDRNPPQDTSKDITITSLVKLITLTDSLYDKFGLG